MSAPTRGREMLRIRRKVMGIRDVCVPGGGTPPLREDGRLGGFAVGWCGYGRLCCTPHQSKIGDF